MIGTGSFATDELFSSGLTAGYALVIAFLFGIVFGSFINCMAWRLACRMDPDKDHGDLNADSVEKTGGSILNGRSRCPDCGHILGAADLIPVVSYLALRGKCRYCGKKISPRYVIAEIVCGIGFVLCLWKWGLSFDMLRALLWFCLMLCLSLVDLQISIIPDRFLIAGIVVWVATLGLVHQSVTDQLLWGLIGAVALGGGMLLMSLLFDRLTGKESMGGGDIKLYFVCGLYLGPWKGLLCLILSCIIGLGAAAAQQKGRDTPFPFGPSICLACFICMLAGDAVISWYLSLF